MSKTIKTIASIALPIVGNIIAPGIGGLIGGAIGGGISGGVPGALMGAVGGYASGGAVSNIMGASAGAPLSTVTGVAGMQGPTMGSGIMGAVTGGGLRALGQGVSTAAAGAVGDPSKFLLNIGNQLMTQQSANTAEEAARIQSRSINKALETQQPYGDLGADAVARIKEIQADPAAWVAKNPMYSSLAKDAERRLLANQAAKGKVGSGGTAAALQDQLLQIGNGLVQTELGNLRGSAGIGQTSATNQANLYTAQGDVNAAGTVGANNAWQNGYMNQINTLLAMRGLQGTPSYNPRPMLNF